MKKIMFLTALVLSMGIYSNVNAQKAPTVSTPSVSGDKDLSNRDIKDRSIDLERTERDANKTAGTSENNSSDKKTTTAAAEDKLAAKYAEIKTDFEQIQISQDAVIKAYQNTVKIDYGQISKSAQEINKSAKRLDSNLFPVLTEKTEKKSKKAETAKEPKSTKSVRDLIVELDNTVGSFATSPLFQNLRVVDPKAAANAKLDLEKIIELSALLDAAAQKTTAEGK